MTAVPGRDAPAALGSLVGLSLVGLSLVRLSLVGLSLAAARPATAQQVPDTTFRPEVGPPAYAEGAGPRVGLDEAHVNFHTLEGRYHTFGRLLSADGVRVRAFGEAFRESALEDVDVLVVANALHARNENDWSLPTPSAFTDDEIAAVRRWVEGGGGLLIIADHMPFAGAAEALAAAFGFESVNGFAMEGAGGPLVFRASDGSLAAHEVTGRAASGARRMPIGGTSGPVPYARVDSVATFTGQAFRVPDGATSLLTFRPGAYSLNPSVAWEFDERTPRTDVSGWSQGAVLEVGRGRVALFGEAAMFSAQLSGPQRLPAGMNTPVAAQNPLLLLNLARWLAADGR